MHRTVKKLIILNGFFLCLMSLFRLAFCCYYGSAAELGGRAFDLAKAFVMGVRFDLVVVAYINALVTLTLLVVWAARSGRLFAAWKKALEYYYFLMYSLVFLVLCVDFGFYSYFKSHINILIFGVFEDDTKALFSTIAENYNLPLAALGFIALFALVFFAARRVMSLPEKAPTGRPYRWGYKLTFAAALVAFNVLAARGSLGLFPLGTMDAEVSPSVFINRVGINGIFTLQEALEARMKENREEPLLDRMGYRGDPAQAYADLLGIDKQALNTDLMKNLEHVTPANPAAERIRPNVVVFVMEGFGSDLLRYNSPRFNVMGALKEHFDTDYVFYNFLSGDVGTIGSLESVVLNMPKRPQSKAVTQSRFAFNRFPTGCALPYRAAGYETMFFYGGNTGWRNIVPLCQNAGFDVVEGEGAMPASYLRNQWGVYDEFLFDYVEKELGAADGKPKFILALSTSNHPPYSLPPSYKTLPLEIDGQLAKDITGDRKLALGRFQTYQYACNKLGEFISRIKASPLGQNTVIAVTGDHNFWNVFDYSDERFPDIDGVPFYVYVPPALAPKSKDTAVFGSHIDIMPTLYCLSLSKQKYSAVGTNLFDPSFRHVAYNVDGIVMTPQAASRWQSANGSEQYFRWDSARPRTLARTEKTAAHAELVQHYKAAIAVTDHVIRNSSAHN